MSVTSIFRNALARTPLSIRANSAVNQFAGSTTLGSGSATVTVSTTSIRSNSLIFLGAHSLTDQSSGVAAAIEVRTIVDKSHFILGNSDGIADARETTIFWMIANR